MVVSALAVESLLGSHVSLAFLPSEVHCDSGVRFLCGFITENSTRPRGCSSDSSLFLSAAWIGLEVAGLRAGRSPGVCVFYLHSEGVAVLLGALEISPVYPRGHLRKAVAGVHSHGLPEFCQFRAPPSWPQSPGGGEVSPIFSSG